MKREANERADARVKANEEELDRIKAKFPGEQVFYTKLLEEVDPNLVKWKSKTEVK